jgi:hypothetical protein
MSLVTDALAVLMVLFAVLGMGAVALNARNYDMIDGVEGVLVAVAIVFVLVMSFGAIF